MKAKKIISAIVLLGIIGAFIAYKMYNKPHVNVAGTKSDIVLTADKILTDFSTNETEANNKYLEKIIEVSGVVLETSTEKEKGIVTLKTNNDFGSVLCHLSDKSTKKINDIEEGQSIKLKGICTGYLMDVILVKCEIIN